MRRIAGVSRADRTASLPLHQSRFKAVATDGCAIISIRQTAAQHHFRARIVEMDVVAGFNGDGRAPVLTWSRQRVVRRDGAVVRVQPACVTHRGVIERVRYRDRAFHGAPSQLPRERRRQRRRSRRHRRSDRREPTRGNAVIPVAPRPRSILMNALPGLRCQSARAQRALAVSCAMLVDRGAPHIPRCAGFAAVRAVFPAQPRPQCRATATFLACPPGLSGTTPSLLLKATRLMYLVTRSQNRRACICLDSAGIHWGHPANLATSSALPLTTTAIMFAAASFSVRERTIASRGARTLDRAPPSYMYASRRTMRRVATRSRAARRRACGSTHWTTRSGQPAATAPALRRPLARNRRLTSRPQRARPLPPDGTRAPPPVHRAVRPSHDAKLDGTPPAHAVPGAVRRTRCRRGRAPTAHPRSGPQTAWPPAIHPLLS